MSILLGDVRTARERLDALGAWYAARPRGDGDAVEETLERLVAVDVELASVARTARIALLEEVERRAGPFDARYLTALLDVPRERFVRYDDVGASALDSPLSLDDEGLATISAPHAYLLSFRALGLSLGDRLAELGSGSGYGAALASQIVGPGGRVLTIEIDRALASRAERLLEGCPNVEALHGDATSMSERFAGFDRVTVTFAIDRVPDGWLAALPEGGRLVAPIGPAELQRLMVVERVSGALRWTDHGGVRYVPNRAERSRTYRRA